jgi:uncharacterized protein YggU (UPF0235/DUF167 family)
VRVTPKAARAAIRGCHGEGPRAAVRVSVTAAPVDGKANKAVKRLLAKRLGLAPSSLELRRGETAREKEIFVPGLSPEEILAALLG